MSKELQALEDVILFLNTTEPKGLYCKNIEIIKTALKDLEYLQEKTKGQENTIKMLMQENHKMKNDAKTLRIIKEEFGIDFITPLKALKNGIYVKKKETIKKKITIRFGGELYSKWVNEEKEYIEHKDINFLTSHSLGYRGYSLGSWDNDYPDIDYEYLYKDYGDTWASTKEELL